MQEETGPESIDLVWHVAVEERDHSTDLTQARYLQHRNAPSDMIGTSLKLENTQGSSHLQESAT